MIHEVTEENYKEEILLGEAEIKKKFDAWDLVGKQNLKLNEFKAKAAWLWKDPTIWSYATLKDKQNKQLKLFYFQDTIINDKNSFVHASCANQIGKTWAMIIKALHHALHTNNASVMLISRSEDQAKSILDEMKWMLNRGKINFKTFEDEISNRFEYHLKSPDGLGTSVIRVFPPTMRILGFPSTLTIMDETGFWQKESDLDPIELYQQVIEPRRNATKNWKHPFLTMGQIVSITNPNGQNGLAWWLFNNKKYNNYRYCWLANPGNSLEDYRIAEGELPPIRFASVYAAKYILASGGFITLDQYERFRTYNVPMAIPPATIYLGGDFASEDPKTKHTDSAVIYGVVKVPNVDYPQNPRIRVVYRKSYDPGTKRVVIYKDIERIKNLNGVYIGKFAYDKVGVGDSVKTDLIGRNILNEHQIEPLTYSLPNKSEVYLNFQRLFLQDMIEGTHIESLQEQLLALRVEQPTGSPHIKVHHKTEGVKDDEPDALANACYVAKGNAGYAEARIVMGKSPSVKYDSVVKRGIRSNEKFMDMINSQKEGFYI